MRRIHLDFYKLSSILSEFEDGHIYLSFEPEVFDFTDKDAQPKLNFYGQNKIDFSIVLTDENLFLTLSLLKLSLFSKRFKIITYNWKNFASFVVAKTKKTFSVECSIIDLKILESYSGNKGNPPTSFAQALHRLRNLITSGLWKEIEERYKNIFLPLMTCVIPHLETTHVLDLSTGARVFAHYDIDGQENGRLRCSNVFKSGFVPHALKPDQKDCLKVRDSDDLFMYFDFKGMEVFVLAALSNDKLLRDLCAEKDVYAALWTSLTNQEVCQANDRDLVKKMFLPVIYGQSAYSLSQRLGISKESADAFVDSIKQKFKTSLSYVQSHEEFLKQYGYTKDIFGKRRTNYESGKEYLARNFSIQAPSALICMEKLIDLYFALNDKTAIAYTVHDGYVVYANKKNWNEIYQIGLRVLTAESKLLPNLKLKVSCKAGRKLNALKSITKGNQ